MRITCIRGIRKYFYLSAIHGKLHFKSSILVLLKEQNIFPDIGNNEELFGIQIEGDDVDFFKVVPTDSYEECRVECRNRFFCRSW